MFMTEASFLMDSMSDEMYQYGIDDLEMIENWAFDVFDDMDIETFLYSGLYLTNEDTYHFVNWSKPQFFIMN